MIEHIRVTCGEEEYKFKLGSSSKSVLDILARMHPPCGCLKHVDDVTLVVLSQEQLSQKNYTYHPGHSTEDIVDECLMSAVCRLQVKKGKELEMCGTAVVCTSTGLCVTADHCLNDVPRRPKLLVGGHPAKICARDAKKDIAALKIDGKSDLQCINLDGTSPIKKMMKVQLISYPVIAESDFDVMETTVTHGQVVNLWTPNLVGADYTSFSNSSGGAVVYKNRLIGIHLESLWQEDGQVKGEMGIEGKVAYLERNMGNKGCLGNFVNAAAICNFLYDHSLLAMPTFGNSSSATSSVQGKRPRMVSSLQ